LQKKISGYFYFLELSRPSISKQLKIASFYFCAFSGGAAMVLKAVRGCARRRSAL
jgi:hypothetical protein